MDAAEVGGLGDGFALILHERQKPGKNILRHIHRFFLIVPAAQAPREVGKRYGDSIVGVVEDRREDVVPFTATVLAMVLGLILGPPDGPGRHRRAWIVGSVVLIVVANFWFIYPILTDQLMTRTMWSLRMWFSSWI